MENINELEQFYVQKYIFKLLDFLKRNQILSALDSIKDYDELYGLLIESEYIGYECRPDIKTYALLFKIRNDYCQDKYYVFIFGKNSDNQCKVSIDINRDISLLTLAWNENKLPPFLSPFIENLDHENISSKNGSVINLSVKENIMSFEEFSQFLHNNEKEELNKMKILKKHGLDYLNNYDITIPDVLLLNSNVNYHINDRLKTICSPFKIFLDNTIVRKNNSILKSMSIRDTIINILDDEKNYVFALISNLGHLGSRKKEKVFLLYSCTIDSLTRLISHLFIQYKKNHASDTLACISKLQYLLSIKRDSELMDNLYKNDITVIIPALYLFYQRYSANCGYYTFENDYKIKNPISSKILREKDILKTSLDIINNSCLIFNPAYGNSLLLCGMVGKDCNQQIENRIQNPNACFYKIFNKNNWLGYFTLLDITLPYNQRALLFDVFNVNPEGIKYVQGAIKSILDRIEIFLQGTDYSFILMPGDSDLFSNNDSLREEVYKDSTNYIENTITDVQSFSSFHSVASKTLKIARDLNDYGQLKLFG